MSDHIDFVASTAFRLWQERPIGLNQRSNEQNLFALWQSLEDAIKPKHYDVLLSLIKARPYVRELVRTLYAIEGGRPEVDSQQLFIKEKEYGGSWCKRGGIGAFFVAVRKLDRIENQINKRGTLALALEHDKRAEGIRDDLCDLRCYLILWESWWQAL